MYFNERYLFVSGNFLFQKVLQEGCSTEFEKVLEQSSVTADNLMVSAVLIFISASFP